MEVNNQLRMCQISNEGWINYYITLRQGAHMKDTNRDNRNGQTEILKDVTLVELNNILKKSQQQETQVSTI